jgi:hypothetical protein
MDDALDELGDLTEVAEAAPPCPSPSDKPGSGVIVEPEAAEEAVVPPIRARRNLQSLLGAGASIGKDWTVNLRKLDPFDPCS